MASKLVLAMSLFVAVSAKWNETDKAAGVTQFVIKRYTAAGCDASSFNGNYDYKEVGTCILDGSDYKQSHVTATHYVTQTFTDAACTVLKSPLEERTKPKACHSSEDNEWEASEGVDSTVGTLYIEKFNAAGCPDSASDGSAYHGGDKCEKGEDGASYKRVIYMNGGDLSLMTYTSQDCTGTATESFKFVGNGVCTAYASTHEDAGKWYKLWVWHPNGITAPTTTTTTSTVAPTTNTTTMNTTITATMTATVTGTMTTTAAPVGDASGALGPHSFSFGLFALSCVATLLPALHWTRH